jgi:aryl-alcohol dehydrogenase-like predicted oxidoreductase
MATEKSLERCRTDHFDAVLLHNPDSTGYSSDTVWKGMQALKAAGLTELLGIAPGPANGFALDLMLSFERFAGLIDWGMIILNPLEPWPGRLCLGAAKKHGVKLITRVVDYGGVFHDDVKPGHKFGSHDHRAFRPAGWVEAGFEKAERMRPISQKHGLTMLQLACLWNLSQPAVESVIPTFIQETTAGAKSIEDKVAELAALPDLRLTESECAAILEIGNNQGCMRLSSPAVSDRWFREKSAQIPRRLSFTNSTKIRTEPPSHWDSMSSSLCLREKRSRPRWRSR